MMCLYFFSVKVLGHNSFYLFIFVCILASTVVWHSKIQFHFYPRSVLLVRRYRVNGRARRK